MKIFWLVVLFLIFITIMCSGCASNERILRDEKGNYIKCTSSGYGIMGTAMANKHFNDCVENAKQKGYK